MHILILGASARAAAFSARRAGLPPIAVDLFADLDLRRVGRADRVAPESYPEGLAIAAAAAPDAPWIYTGSLENQPELVERIARQRPLWGNDGPTLRAVRDPLAVAEVLRRVGLRRPEVRSAPHGLPRDGSWLVKPLASAGGRGIAPLEPRTDVSGIAQSRPGADVERRVEPPRYYQERIAGPSLAALFIAARGGEAATLAGVSRQWIGRDVEPFAYVGSLGPWPIAPRVRARIEAMGRALADAFRLVGLFGVDLILRDGEPWPVEINPRYTASVEVLELALGRPLLAEHIRACDPKAAVRLATVGSRPRSEPSFVGKRIVFAPSRCRFPGIDERSMPGGEDDAFAIPLVADIPEPGARFEAGEPVLTVFASGPTVAACRRRLDRRHACWERRLRLSS